MIPTDLVIAQLVPELQSTLSIGPAGALAIAIVVGLLAAVIVGTVSELRAAKRQQTLRDRGTPARAPKTRRAA